MVQWKNRQLHSSVQEVDDDGLDPGNSPFLKLSIEEAIQAVRDGMDEEHLPVEMKGPVGPDQ
jgi:hypothetical protein